MLSKLKKKQFESFLKSTLVHLLRVEGKKHINNYSNKIKDSIFKRRKTITNKTVLPILFVIVKKKTIS